MRSRGARPGSSLLLALAAAGALVSCGPSVAPAPSPPEVQVVDVVVRDVPIYREWVGELRGAADVDIRARVQGVLEKIHFVEGTEVEKGQVLYSIDPSELEQGVAAAEAQVAEARTLLANAEADVRRYRPLAEINAVAQRDLENAVAREEATGSQVEAAQAELRLAKIQLSYAEVRSPMKGLIGLSRVKVGDLVGQPLTSDVLNTVSDIYPIHVRFPITEQEYLEVARRLEKRSAGSPPGKRASLQLILADGSVYPEAGEVYTVDRSVNASTGTLTIEASFPNPGGLLRPGLYGKVRTQVAVLPSALLVPQRAVQEVQELFQVWVVRDDDTVELRVVKTGPRVGDLWVIEEGLDAGLRVVVEGIQRLRQGIPVVATPYEPPQASQDPDARS